jgi:hypothetical protein
LRARAAWHFGGGPNYCRGCQALQKECGAQCPYEQHAPLSVDGAAVWQAALAAVVADMAGLRIDMSGALAIAIAAGATSDAAADLLPSIVAGMHEAQAKERSNG